MTAHGKSKAIYLIRRLWKFVIAVAILLLFCFVQDGRAVRTERPGDFSTQVAQRHIREILAEMPVYDPVTKKMSHENPPSHKLRQAVADLQQEWQKLYDESDLHDLVPPSRAVIFERCDDTKKNLSGPILTKLDLEEELLILKQQEAFVQSAWKQLKLRNWLHSVFAMLDTIKEIINSFKSVASPSPEDVGKALKDMISKLAENAGKSQVANPSALVIEFVNATKLGKEGLKYFFNNTKGVYDSVDEYVKKRNFKGFELKNRDFLVNELKLHVREYLQKQADEDLNGVPGDPGKPGLRKQIAEIEKKLVQYSGITIRPGQYQYKEYAVLCQKISDLRDWKPRQIKELRIVQPNVTIKVGETVSFKAIGKYSGGTEFYFTDKVIWPAGKTFTGTKPGKFTISADYRGLTAVANITVITTTSIKDLQISPAQIKIGQGQSAKFKATAEFWDGSVGDVTPVAVWDKGPEFQATQTGTYTVTVTYLGKNAVATVTVTRVPPVPAGLSVDRLSISPSDALISIGETINFSARARFSDGIERDVTRGATWTPDSSFTAEKSEIVTIVAAYGGITAEVFLIVTPDPGPRPPVTGPSGTGAAGKYNILFRPDGTQRPNCFAFYLAAVGGRAVSSPGVLTPLGTREGWSVDSSYGAGSQAGWSWAYEAAASSRMMELSVYGGDAYGCLDDGVGSQPPPSVGVGQVNPLPPGVEPWGVWRRKAEFDRDRPNCYEFASSALSSPNNYDIDARKREGWVREPNFFGPYSAMGASAAVSQLSRFGGDYYCCVRQRPPMAVLITPLAQSIGLGEEATLQALAYYEDGTSRDISAEARWSRPTPFYGGSPGVYTITADYKGLTGSATVTVADSSVIGVVISSSQDVYKIGESAYFSATAVYSDGSTRYVTRGRELTWDPNDYITGDTEGVYYVSATYKGIKSTHSVRFENDSTNPATSQLSIASLSAAGAGGAAGISAGAPMSATATVSVGDFTGTIAIEWQRLSDGAGSGDIQVVTVAPYSEISVSKDFPPMSAGMGGITYDAIQLTVSDGADLSVQATVDFEWKPGDEFLGFSFKDADSGKAPSKFEIGDTVVVTGKWKAVDDPEAGRTRHITFFANGTLFHEQADIAVQPGRVFTHPSTLDTGSLGKGSVLIRSDLYDPKTDTASSGNGKFIITEGKDEITSAQASLSLGSGGAKKFTAGETVFINTNIAAAKKPDGPRTLTLSYQGKSVLSEAFDMKGGEAVSRAFSINTGKLDTGRHVFMVQLYNEKGRQDHKIVRIKVQEDPNASGTNAGGLQNVTCTGDTVSIKIWDHGQQDGDIVTLRMGGQTILSGFDMNACGGSEPGGPPCAFVGLPFPAGSQVSVSITAHNEGSSSPNTAALKVEGGCTPELQHWGLKTGETSSIVISRVTAQPAAQAGQAQSSGPPANAQGAQASSQVVQSWP